MRYPAQRHIDEGVHTDNKSLSNGIRLHRIFERAHTESDLLRAIEHMTLDCMIDAEEATKLKGQIGQMLANPTVSEWFNGSWDEIKCEAEIIAGEDTRRPDRVMIKDKRAVIVDYKFGENRSSQYSKQMAEYMSLLGKMGRYDQIEGYVWYIALGTLERVE